MEGDKATADNSGTEVHHDHSHQHADIHHNAEEAPHHVAAHRKHHQKAMALLSGYKSKIHRKHVIAGVIYLLISLVIFSPIAANMSTVAPGVGGDLYTNLWGIWWANYAVFQTHTNLWYTYLLFWPVGSNIAYFTFAPIAAILTAPFQSISITFAYDMIFFLGFLISGLGMFVLADYIVKNKYAAFFAGIVFAFGAFHVAVAIGHLDWMVIGWVPVALYFFIRMIKDEHKYQYAIGLGASLVLATFMGDVEQGLMTAVLLAVVFVCYLLYPKTRHLFKSRKLWYALALSAIAAFIIGSWGFMPLIHGYTAPGGASNINSRNTLPNDAEWSSPILSFLLPSPYNGLLYGLASNYSSIYSVDPNERIAYIGYTAILLAIIGIWKNFKASRLWIIIAIFFGWMVLGPFVQLGQYTGGGLPGIYYIYHYIPGFNVLQEADRFYVVFSIAIAMLAAFGMKSLVEKFQKPKIDMRLIGVLGIFTVLFLAESSGVMTTAFAQLTTTTVSVPQFYKDLGATPGNFTVLQLPIILNNYIQYPDLAAGQASFYTSASHKPILGGYGGRINETQQLSLLAIPLAVAVYNLQLGNFTYQSPVIENYTAESLLSLYNYQTGFVVINEQVFNASDLSQLESYGVATFGQPIYADNNTIAFSTQKAINASLFKSYVSYPFLPDWTGYSVLINGTYLNLWQAGYPGLISVFAPYKNATDIQAKVYSRVPYTINTTVSFVGISNNGASSLLVEVPVSQTSYQKVAEINLTSTLTGYSFNMSMVSGAQGNPLLFVTQGTGTPLFGGITFSERK